MSLSGLGLFLCHLLLYQDVRLFIHRFFFFTFGTYLWKHPMFLELNYFQSYGEKSRIHEIIECKKTNNNFKKCVSKGTFNFMPMMNKHSGKRE